MLRRNTIGIGPYSLPAGFTQPIQLAVSLNEAGSRRYQRTVQMVAYAPYFISTVVFVDMVTQVLDQCRGIANVLIGAIKGRGKEVRPGRPWCARAQCRLFVEGFMRFSGGGKI